MLLTLALFAAQLAGFPCFGERVCIAANEFRDRYAVWTEIMNRTRPGTTDAREPRAWSEVERYFRQLQKARKCSEDPSYSRCAE